MIRRTVSDPERQVMRDFKIQRAIGRKTQVSPLLIARRLNPTLALFCTANTGVSECGYSFFGMRWMQLALSFRNGAKAALDPHLQSSSPAKAGDPAFRRCD
jgi:hypothetical protein